MTIEDLFCSETPWTKPEFRDSLAIRFQFMGFKMEHQFFAPVPPITNYYGIHIDAFYYDAVDNRLVIAIPFAQLQDL